MSEFKIRHHNRRQLPVKFVLVAEDDTVNQGHFAGWACSRFDCQGQVQFDFVASGITVAAILMSGVCKPNLIILDHDLPYGNASDLLAWMHEHKFTDIPVITASGMPENNKHMVHLCLQYGIECHHFQKHEVYAGYADQVIHGILSK